jgi:hypothetical protein
MVALKHTVWNEGEKTVYFYEGELKAKDGVLEVPDDRPEWLRRAWVMGYRLDPKTGENILFDDLVPTEVISAESEEGQDEQEPKKKSSGRRGRSAS